MVINSQDQITEAVAYQAYGAMVPLDSIANAPEIPAREKFTGKEFDTEGEDSANGVIGIQAYHFGARVYDPDVGVWLSVDPAEQDFFVYGYCNGNPIIFVDPNGENWIGAIIGAAIGGTIGGIAAYNASDGHAGATMAGILVGGVWGGALGSMAGSGISGAAGAGGAATAGSAGAGTGIGAAGASLLRAGTVASQIFSNISAHSYSNNMLQVAGDGVVPATRMPGWVTNNGITWDLAVSRAEKYLQMHPNVNYESGDYACATFAHYVITGKDLKYSQVEPMFGTKPLVNKINPNSWYVVTWTHPDAASHVGVLHGGNVIHRAEGYKMIMPFKDLNASLTNLGYDQIPGYSPIYYNWGNR